MKRQRISTIVGALALCGSALFPGSVFAANAGNFGITYSGGNLLGSENVTKDGNIEDELELVIPAENVKVDWYGNGWNEGYMKREGGPCRKYKYLRVNANGIVNGGGTGFKISSGEYTMDVKIPAIGTENFVSSLGETAVGIVDQASATVNNDNSGISALYGGWAPYSDASCTTPVSGIRSMTSVKTTDHPELQDEKIFVEMQIKLLRKNERFVSDELYFGIIDIDASQSYKILSQDSVFAKGRLFAKDYANLQPDGDDDRKNRYVTTGSDGKPYIYSQYNDDHGGFDTDNISNLYAKIDTKTQESTNGLDIVFGFAGIAGSQVQYYSKEYTVRYFADKPGGTVKIRNSEKVVSGASPLGADQMPDSGYKFTHWTANKDVVINGETITKGDSISMEQIKSIRVKQNYDFTAHYEKDEPETKQYTVEYVPDKPGGDVTGITSEKVNEGENPSGSEAEAEDGYTVSHWTTDQDVTLENGETIKKGEVISAEDIQKVVVDKDMRFIVHFKKKETPNTPNTGAMSGNVDAATIATASIFGIVLIALAIKALPRLTHKKVNFD